MIDAVLSQRLDQPGTHPRPIGEKHTPRLALVDSPRTAAELHVLAVAVTVHAADPISKAGILSQLRQQAGLRIVEGADPVASVALLVADALDEVTVRQLRTLNRSHSLGVVLVIGLLDPRAMVAVLDSGVRAVLSRADATPERLVRVIHATADGQVDFPPELLRHLIDQVGRVKRDVLEPRGLSFAGLTQREHDVLRLVAEGLSTREVAQQLAYSERTIKNVLQDLTTRMQLRNRTQAVAYAVRNGWI